MHAPCKIVGASLRRIMVCRYFQDYILRSTRCDSTVNSELRMHRPCNILGGYHSPRKFIILQMYLRPGLEVGLLHVYSGFRFEDACPMQYCGSVGKENNSLQMLSRTRTWVQPVTIFRWNPIWRCRSHARCVLVFFMNIIFSQMFSWTRARGRLVAMLHVIPIWRCKCHAICVLLYCSLWKSYFTDVF